MALKMKAFVAVCMAAGLAVAVAGQADRPLELVTIELPAGKATAGRQAFEDLKCHLCHRVAGETRFPAPTSAARGPDLGDEAVRLQTPSEVAAAIVSPSHSMSVRTNQAVKERLRTEDASPMGDFSSRLTVRQLADLLAYLRSPAARR
jgi:L-cysteine S-thiosulfotransferase